MSLKIRKATRKDVPIILGLLYELGRPKPKTDLEVDVFRKIVKNHITDSDSLILVAEIDEIHIVGMASLIFLHRLNQSRYELYLPELIVTKKYQNQGVGAKLIEECISLGRKKNCYRIRLESGVSRKSAHKFYHKMGFESNSHSFSKIIE